MRTVRTVGLAVGTFVLGAGIALAHCDSLSGPVIREATTALEKGDVTAVLKWVRKDDEAAVKSDFAKAVAVRAQGPDARDLADRYFLETLVRLHRAGEGFPFTGIKDELPEPIVRLTDQALAAGSPEDLIRMVQGHVSEAIREKFNRVIETAKTRDRSVEAGRAYVAAYVEYTHFVEGVHAALTASSASRPAPARCSCSTR